MLSYTLTQLSLHLASLASVGYMAMPGQQKERKKSQNHMILWNKIYLAPRRINPASLKIKQEDVGEEREGPSSAHSLRRPPLSAGMSRRGRRRRRRGPPSERGRGERARASPVAPA